MYLKSGLEKEIDDAVERGDFSTAEKLSDQLATREVCWLIYMFSIRFKSYMQLWMQLSGSKNI